MASASEATPEAREGRAASGRSVAMGLAAACFFTLPDVLEPAFHPNHRKFFHSLAFAGLLGCAMFRLYEWRPEGEFEQLARFAGLAVSAAYLAHVARGFFTAKSLFVQCLC